MKIKIEGEQGEGKTMMLHTLVELLREWDRCEISEINYVEHSLTIELDKDLFAKREG